MRLSVIVPATDGPPTLRRCLDAIEAAGPDELIVVETPRSAGPAVARNLGAAKAGGEVLVFVDSDVLMHPDALRRIRDRLLREPELVGVFGSYDDHVATRGLVAGYRNLQHRVIHQRSAGQVESFWAGLGAVRASVFRAAGGFDETRYTRPSIEDIELGTRLVPFGPIVLDPMLLGTHLKEWTLTSMVTTDFRARGVPWVRLSLRQGRAPRGLNLGWRERASAASAVALCACLLTGRRRAAAATLLGRLALNHDLYAALRRTLGPRGAAAGAGLHVLHEMTAVCAVPSGVAAEVAAQATRLTSRRPSTRAPASR